MNRSRKARSMDRRVKIHRHRRRIQVGVIKMIPERAQDNKKIWIVAHWKFHLDAGTPWWRQLFFEWVFKPFLRFSFSRMKVPPPKGAIIEGRKQTFFWYETGGCFSSEEQADIACTSELHGYKDLPFDRQFPPESAQYSDFVFPRRKNPRPRPKPVLGYVLTPRREQEQIRNEVARLREILDQ